MGLRYVFFRLKHVVAIKTGRLKSKFPTNPEFKTFSSLAEWRKNAPAFFFQGKEIKGLVKTPTEALEHNFKKIKSGSIRFFSHSWYDLGTNFDWITNPDTGYTYNINRHWSDIESLSAEKGDIKYVWE